MGAPCFTVVPETTSPKGALTVHTFDIGSGLQDPGVYRIMYAFDTVVSNGFYQYTIVTEWEDPHGDLQSYNEPLSFTGDANGRTTGGTEMDYGGGICRVVVTADSLLAVLGVESSFKGTIRIPA